MNQLKALETEIRKKSIRAAFGIIGFLIVYILLILFGIALSLALVYAGIAIVVMTFNSLAVIFALAMGAVALVVLKYLFRFLNRKKEETAPVELQISAKDQPELFALLKEITKEIGTKMPRKVFITPDVNASVHFNSSFWSLFGAASKNLKLGWPLVNGINKTEFKFILAHEFGHFSQGSMRLGSYTYQSNQILGSLLLAPEERQFDQAQRFGLISVGKNIGMGIVYAMEYLLKQFFRIINHRYLDLSRQMEFHADALAANLYGPEGQRYSLNRSHFIQNCLDLCFSFYNSGKGSGFESDNIFENHRQVQSLMIMENGIPNLKGWAIISEADEDEQIKSRIELGENWSSHPENKERIESLNKINEGREFPEMDHDPAIDFFRNKTELENELSAAWLKTLNYELEVRPKLSSEDFEQFFRTYYRSRRYHAIYQDYYDSWDPRNFEFETIKVEAEKGDEDPFNLFNKEQRLNTLKLMALEEDLGIIQSIATKNLVLKSFKYLDKKYKQLEAGKVAQMLKADIKPLREKVSEHDAAIFASFYLKAKARGKGPEFEELLNNWKNHRIYRSEDELHVAAEYLNSLSFINVTTPYETIRENFRKLKPKDSQFRTDLKMALENEDLKGLLSNDGKELLQNFLKSEPHYFEGESYLDEPLTLLISSLQVYLQLLLPEMESIAKSNFLHFQSTLIDQAQLEKAAQKRLNALDESLA